MNPTCDKLLTSLFVAIGLITVIRGANTALAQANYEPYAINTFAGFPDAPGSEDGTGSTARFLYPFGIALDRSDNLFVADTNNHTIRKITPGGVVTTFAGLAGNPGSADGTGSDARFQFPTGVAVDTADNVYVADYANDTIRKITSGGEVTTFAGLALSQGSTDGNGSDARFFQPQGVAVDGAGNVYAADTHNHTIRKITPSGAVTTFAGLANNPGSADGTGSDARFFNPFGLATDKAGNVYVADSYNHTIRRIAFGGTVTTLAGLALTPGSTDGAGAAARFNQPFSVAADGAGNIYVADYSNDTVRKVTAGGVVTTLAGLALNPGSADGTGSAARFYQPEGVTADDGGALYVTDSSNHTIRFGIPATTPSLQGNFVIGDRNAVVGNHVTFWGGHWAELNSLSGGPAPDGFKGFANSTSPNPAACGGSWAARTGNSAAPPNTLPPYITVLAASSITKVGSTIAGNIPATVIVRIDPGYEPNSGHAGTGTVVLVLCH
jgi:NHL repeat